jgi:hypothetical protein
MRAVAKLFMFQVVVMVGLLVAAVGVFMEMDILSKDCKVAETGRVLQILGVSAVGLGFILMTIFLTMRGTMSRLGSFIVIIHAIAVVVITAMELENPKKDPTTAIRHGLLAVLACLASFILFVRSSAFETHTDASL